MATQQQQMQQQNSTQQQQQQQNQPLKQDVRIRFQFILCENKIRF